MSSNQGYSDLITRIRNGYRANLVSVSFVHTSRNVRLLRVLRDGGFISGWSDRVASNIESKNVKDLSLSNFTKGTVFLRYVDGVPALLSIETISKQSRRVYLTLSEIEVFLDEEGFGRLLVLSTSKGLLTHIDAIQQHIGGEVICALK